VFVHRCKSRLGIGAAVLLVSLTGLAQAEWNWPRWRGPEGTGHTAETGVPVKWDARDIIWKTPLRGRGQSSPIVWGERLFLTTALDGGKERVVLGVDRKSGKVLWEQTAWKGEPEKSHVMNGWASATCCTDGERVVAFFGKGGLHCYSVEGKPLWSRTDLGPFDGPWGTAACPIIVGEMVIQNCDALGEAYLLAVDRKTGKTVWKTPRPLPLRGGWSTPLLVSAGSRQELVLNGEAMVVGYDPATGKPLWTCKTFNGRGEPSPAAAHGLVYLVNGLAGDVYAVRPGGSGDITKSHMAWHTPRKVGRDQPSPIVVGNYLIVTSMDGIAVCYDAVKGTELWKERLQGKFTSSPIAAGGLIYFQSESGETYVLKPGPKMELAAKNTLGAPSDEIFRASLTPSDGQIFTRSDRMLYCIGQRKSASR
jgi:outer membrane protein assembly factor BamB